VSPRSLALAVTRVCLGVSQRRAPRRSSGRTEGHDQVRNAGTPCAAGFGVVAQELSGDDPLQVSVGVLEERCHSWLAVADGEELVDDGVLFINRSAEGSREEVAKQCVCNRTRWVS